MPTDKFTKQSLHKAGAFAVAQLVNSKQHNIVVAAPQDKKVDLRITNKESGKRYRIKVSVTDMQINDRGSAGVGLTWMLNKDNQKEDQIADNLYYCFVHLKTEGEKTKFRFFVVPSKIVAEYLKNSFDLWLDEVKGRDKNNEVRIFLLGQEDGKYPLGFKTPFENEYEDKWDLLV